MNHSEYQVAIPAATAVALCGQSPSRSSLRFKVTGTQPVYIGNGPGVRQVDGYMLEPDSAATPHELELHYPWGDDTTQAFYAYNTSSDTPTTVCVMEHCCPKLHLPEELAGGIP